MNTRNVVRSLKGTPTEHSASPRPVEGDRFPARAAIPRDPNEGTMPTGIRAGDVHFSYYKQTKDFYTLALYYSPGVMLTPGYVNACEGASEEDSWELEDRAKKAGADWSYLRLLGGPGERRLWICRGDLTLHATSTRLTELFSDLCEALRQADLDPEQYFAPPA